MNSYYAIFAKFSICTSPLCFINLQWGSDYSDSNGEKLIIFPISLKKFVKAVSTNVNSNTSIAPANLSSVNINNFKLHCKGNNEQYFINLCHWIAIGV
jgi:hypothetical protein